MTGVRLVHSRELSKTERRFTPSQRGLGAGRQTGVRGRLHACPARVSARARFLDFAGPFMGPDLGVIPDPLDVRKRSFCSQPEQGAYINPGLGNQAAMVTFIIVLIIIGLIAGLIARLLVSPVATPSASWARSSSAYRRVLHRRFRRKPDPVPQCVGQLVPRHRHHRLHHWCHHCSADPPAHRRRARPRPYPPSPLLVPEPSSSPGSPPRPCLRSRENPRPDHSRLSPTSPSANPPSQAGISFAQTRPLVPGQRRLRPGCRGARVVARGWRRRGRGAGGRGVRMWREGSWRGDVARKVVARGRGRPSAGHSAA